MKMSLCNVRWAAVACALGSSTPAIAATIYGTIQENDRALPKTQVTLVCAGASAKTSTDQRGAYQLTLNRKGVCTLRVAGASAPVALYDDPTRYNFEIRRAGGQVRLVPK